MGEKCAVKARSLFSLPQVDEKAGVCVGSEADGEGAYGGHVSTARHR